MVKVGGRYYVTMDTVVVGGYAADMNDNKGRQRTVKEGRDDDMTEI